MPRRAAAAFFVCCLILAVVPLAACLYFGADFLKTSNESLAYRYFSVARLWQGKRRAVWLPQGFLTSDIQHLIFWSLDRLAGLPVLDLRTRLNVFAVGTVAVNSLAIAALFLWATLDPVLRWSDRFLLAVVTFVPIYGTVTLGFFWFVAPDYLATNVLLVSLGLYLFQRGWRSHGEGRRLSGAAVAGVFAGVAIANKISMVIIGLFPLGVAILAPGLSAGRGLLRTCVGLLGMVMGLLSVIGGFYGFDFGAVYAVLPKWFEFVTAPGMEPLFWDRLPALLRGYNIDLVAAYALVSFVIAGTVVVVTDRRNWRKITLLGGTFIGAALCWIILLKRPAGTTLFEGAMLLLALSAMAVTACSGARGLFRYAVIAVSVWGAVCASTFSWLDNLLEIRMSSQLADGAWRRHAEVRDWAAGRPVIFVLPDDSYHASTVEELLLKGAAEFPTWRVAPTARWILDAYFPGLSFRSDDELPGPSAGYPGDALLVWLDVAETSTIVERYAGMAEALGRGGVSCRRWSVRNKYLWITHILNACELPAPNLRPPAGFEARRWGTRIVLYWKSDPQVESYRIEMGEPSGGFREIGAVYYPADRYEVEVALPTTTHRFRIRARTGEVIGPPSRIVELVGAAVDPVRSQRRNGSLVADKQTVMEGESAAGRAAGMLRQSRRSAEPCLGDKNTG